MNINKVIVEGEVKIDLTADTVSEFDVIDGVKFHKPNGEVAEGCFVPQELNIRTTDPIELIPPQGAYFSKVSLEILPDNMYVNFISDNLPVITEEDLKGITILRSGVFENMHINELHIPKTVTKIEDCPFGGSYINRVYYPGTLAELEALFTSRDSFLYPVGETWDSWGIYFCSDGQQYFGWYNSGGGERE